MLDPAAVPPVDANELLARFVTQRSQFRQGDRTLKQDLFVPHPRAELSVTRHRDATAEEVWRIGRDVATALGRTLYGRGDLRASDCTAHSLRVEPQPLPKTRITQMCWTGPFRNRTRKLLLSNWQQQPVI